MHTVSVSACLFVLFMSPAVVAAQSGGAPTRAATASTAADTAAIEAGIKLHDQGRYEEAIKKYEEVLKLSPANMTALYELAFSYSANKEYEKSLAAATHGTEYQSDLLPRFYDLMGSAYDSVGEPQKAIDAYRRGIQIVPDASLLYYNMGVTYLESLHNSEEARRAIEKAIALDPREPEFHLMLGQIFQAGGYPTAALLAFSTYLIQDPGGPRAMSAYGFWRAILRGETAQNAASAGQARMPAPTADPTPSKTDEGDFRQFEAAIGQSEQMVIAEMDRGAEELPTFLAHVNRLMAALAARPSGQDRDTFVGTYYLPFFLELKEKNFVEPWLYWSMQRAPVNGVRDWLNAHQSEVREFVTWARGYEWPKR